MDELAEKIKKDIEKEELKEQKKKLEQFEI
jgi:hypothetical protein